MPSLRAWARNWSIFSAASFVSLTSGVSGVELVISLSSRRRRRPADYPDSEMQTESLCGSGSSSRYWCRGPPPRATFAARRCSTGASNPDRWANQVTRLLLMVLRACCIRSLLAHSSAQLFHEFTNGAHTRPQAVGLRGGDDNVVTTGFRCHVECWRSARGCREHRQRCGVRGDSGLVEG